MRLAAAANETYAASLAVSELLGCHQCGGGRGQDEVLGGRGLRAVGLSTADASSHSELRRRPRGLRGLGEGKGRPQDHLKAGLEEELSCAGARGPEQQS